jgi:hypothetical protein
MILYLVIIGFVHPEKYLQCINTFPPVLFNPYSSSQIASSLFIPTMFHFRAQAVIINVSVPFLVFPVIEINPTFETTAG